MCPWALQDCISSVLMRDVLLHPIQMKLMEMAGLFHPILMKQLLGKLCTLWYQSSRVVTAVTEKAVI